MNEYSIGYAKYYNSLNNLKIEKNTLVLSFGTYSSPIDVHFPKELLKQVDLVLFEFSLKDKTKAFYYKRNQVGQLISFARISRIEQGIEIYGDGFSNKHLLKIKKIEEFMQDLINREVIY